MGANPLCIGARGRQGTEKNGDDEMQIFAKKRVGKLCFGAELAVLSTALFGWGCSGQKIITVTFPARQSSAEYWVCNRKAEECHGKQEGDVNWLKYKPKMDSLAPPKECAHGVARMEIVSKGNEVTQIGFQCARPNASSGPTTP